MPKKKSDKKVTGKNWIAGAIKKPGSLKEQLGIPAEKTIPSKTLATAAKKPGTLGKRANLAITLKGLGKKKTKKKKG